MARCAAAAAAVARPPALLIVATGLDRAVERAFAAHGEELDVVSYIASGRDRGRFLHVTSEGEALVVHEPNAYAGLPLEARSVLLKVHGQVDRLPSRERESFAVSEDDHIDYLAGGDAAGTVPVQLAARLAPQPSALPRLRRRRLERARVPAPRLGARPARVQLVGGAAGRRARDTRALERARRAGLRRRARPLRRRDGAADRRARRARRPA